MTSSLLQPQHIRKIATDVAPVAVGPYVQAVAHGATIYISGQLPINPLTGKVPSQDAAAQTKQSLQNIADILASAGGDTSQIVKATIFLTRAEDLAAVNAAYADFLDSDYPARSCVVISALPHPQARVEIEAVAVLSEQTPVETAL